MDIGSAEAGLSSPRTISKREFKEYKRSDADPVEYKFGDEITRENFCGAFIESFARGRNSRTAQYAFFSWQERHTGIDVPGLFRNFYDAGGYSCFSDKERQKFRTAYARVAHTQKPGMFDIKLRQGINEFTSDMIDAEVRRRYEENLRKAGYGDIASFPADEFRRQLSAYVKETAQYNARQ